MAEGQSRPESSGQCRRWDSNPHAQRTQHFECCTSTNSVTPASCGIVWDVKGLGDPWGYIEPGLKRVHRRIFRLNDKIESIDREIDQIRAELEYHRAINDDAQRDAAVGNYIDREEAGLTAGDVRRFEEALADLEEKRARLSAKRERWVSGLSD